VKSYSKQPGKDMSLRKGHVTCPSFSSKSAIPLEITKPYWTILDSNGKNTLDHSHCQCP
jgi:hypothetical protein